jgi:single-strand DNA-binding protein
MASLNRVTLIGNVGKDPELRYTTSGQAVASFSLATTDKFKGKMGSMSSGRSGIIL